MTAFNSKDGGFFKTPVGRVQTPTLAIVAEREERIRAFVPRDYWEVRAQFRPPPACTKAAGSTRTSRTSATRKSANRACGRKPPPRAWWRPAANSPAA